MMTCEKTKKISNNLKKLITFETASKMLMELEENFRETKADDKKIVDFIRKNKCFADKRITVTERKYKNNTDMLVNVYYKYGNITFILELDEDNCIGNIICSYGTSTKEEVLNNLKKLIGEDEWCDIDIECAFKNFQEFGETEVVVTDCTLCYKAHINEKNTTKFMIEVDENNRITDVWIDEYGKGTYEKKN